MFPDISDRQRRSFVTFVKTMREAERYYNSEQARLRRLRLQRDICAGCAAVLAAVMVIKGVF